jgi:hypothetical protein
LLLSVHDSVRVDGFGIDKPMLLWINDGLMAIFFLLIGLETKREVLAGELYDRRRAILPVIMAIGGMTVSALIYLAITLNEPDAISGFTMSLFIGTLAFGESDREAPMRLGVLVGSALSALAWRRCWASPLEAHPRRSVALSPLLRVTPHLRPVALENGAPIAAYQTAHRLQRFSLKKCGRNRGRFLAAGLVGLLRATKVTRRTQHRRIG